MIQELISPVAAWQTATSTKPFCVSAACTYLASKGGTERLHLSKTSVVVAHHAGVMEVKTQGVVSGTWSPRLLLLWPFLSVYQPMPKPSPFRLP